MLLRRKTRSQSRQGGYMLLAVMLAVTLMLVAMAAAVQRIAQQVKRQREEELVHRGTDYAMAVKRFVHKNGGRYPTSLEQLENTNHIRFLRKQYKDPTTGESIWRLVHAGEAEIKIPAPNPGLNPSGNPGLSGGSSSLFNNPSTPAVNPSGKAGLVPQGSGLQGNSPAGSSGSLGSLKTSNIGNGPTIGGGQIIGVASVNKAESIKEFNEKDHYNEWFFVYDLRLEQAGGTGITVAAPLAGGGDAVPGLNGQQQPPVQGAPQPGQGSTGALQPGSTPTPTPAVPQ